MNIKEYLAAIEKTLFHRNICMAVLLLAGSIAYPSFAYGEDSRLDVIKVEIGQVDSIEQSKEPVTDFYLSGGEKAGVMASMVLDVYRDKLVRTTEGDSINISVPVGQVKVLKIYEDLAVARIESLTSADKTPVLQYKTVMLGDYAVIKSRKDTSQRPGVAVLSDVLFRINEWKLKPEAKKVLLNILDHYNIEGDKPMIIEGHTCSLGPEKYNLGLSDKRARSVRDYFIKARGLSPDKITVESYGEEKPVASNKTKEGRVKNRRVNIRFLQPDQKQE